VTDLVTGDAVVLELRLARLASRALALCVDLLVQVGALLAGTLLAAGLLESVDDALGGALLLVFVVLVVVGYPVALETLTRGRSLGKLAFGLRVVREDGGAIRFRHALVRGLLGVVEFWVTFGAAALITSLASAKGKRLGDYLAGTVVVRERLPVHGGPVAAMPAPLAGWAAGLDLSALPDDLALAARQYLSRAADLEPGTRDAMADRLAGAVAAVTAPPAPPGVPAWAFLSAVLAERRRRETLRLAAAPGYPGRPAYPAVPPAAPPAVPPAAAPPDERPFAPPQ
jgi:uncharacterized RDD family membrane protein YckC